MTYAFIFGIVVDMNIFAIEKDKYGNVDWVASAQSQDNYRVVKMVLESCQMLCTALRSQGIEDEKLYRPAMPRHPCTLWVGTSSANFLALCEHTQAMLDEYTARFGKIHKCQAVLDACLGLFNEKNFSCHHLTPLAMAMPEHFKSDDVVESYRRYYASKPNVRYPRNKIPKWFVKYRGDMYYNVVEEKNFRET